MTRYEDDEDPTSQIAWPGGRQRHEEPNGDEDQRAPLLNDRRSNAYDSVVGILRNGGVKHSAARHHSPSPGPAEWTGDTDKLSFWQLFALSVSMTGAQIVWTMELGWGTPYLLQLGISEQATSLVWLAGPLSGLVMQPLIGAVSDADSSRYRRRKWIVFSTTITVLVSLALAFAREISVFFVDAFGGGAGDWDPQRNKDVHRFSIALAVISFYLLDFALNALQASLRNLLLDISPASQLGQANAWHGRMIHAGSVLGFAIGFLDLADWKVLHFLGGAQFRKVCILSLLVLVITVTITCWTQDERRRVSIAEESKNQLKQTIRNVHKSIVNLPKPIRRVCMVQLFAFMGWFPFLFYGTTWMGQIMAKESGIDPSVEDATRTGDLAMFIYSIVAVVAGTVLPWLNELDQRYLKPEDLEPHSPPSEGSVPHHPPPAPSLRRIRLQFMLRNIWTAALAFFALIMLSTFWIRKVWQATLAMSLLGICWAVACWVPFAIIMQFLREMESQQPQDEDEAPPPEQETVLPDDRPRSVSDPLARPVNLSRSSTMNGSAIHARRITLTRRKSLMGTGGPVTNDMRFVGPEPVAGGTILGIHNLAIVFPQFAIAILSSIIFTIADGSGVRAVKDPVYLGKTGVAWVLRVGGLFALIGSFVSRRVPPTKTEKLIRQRMIEAHSRENH